MMDLTCAEEAKRDLYRRPHVTYISEKVDDSDQVFRGWCGVYKRYLLVKFDGPAMCISILVFLRVTLQMGLKMLGHMHLVLSHSPWLAVLGYTSFYALPHSFFY
jgi:hypothetical protein